MSIHTKKIIIADDHEIFRFGLKIVIEKNEKYSVIGDVSNGKDLISLAEKLSPDMVISDFIMPDINGIIALQSIKKKNPNIKALLLTNVEDKRVIDINNENQSLDGYVFKSEPIENVLKAIQFIFEDRIYFSMFDENIKLQKIMRNKSTNPFECLSKRELEIISYVVSGYSMRSISEILKIAEKTIENHRANITKKLGKIHIAELVRLAYIWGIMKDDALISTYI